MDSSYHFPVIEEVVFGFTDLPLTRSVGLGLGDHFSLVPSTYTEMIACGALKKSFKDQPPAALVIDDDMGCDFISCGTLTIPVIIDHDFPLASTHFNTNIEICNVDQLVASIDSWASENEQLKLNVDFDRCNLLWKFTSTAAFNFSRFNVRILVGSMHSDVLTIEAQNRKGNSDLFHLCYKGLKEFINGCVPMKSEVMKRDEPMSATESPSTGKANQIDFTGFTGCKSSLKILQGWLKDDPTEALPFFGLLCSWISEASNSVMPALSASSSSKNTVVNSSVSDSDEDSKLPSSISLFLKSGSSSAGSTSSEIESSLLDHQEARTPLPPLSPRMMATLPMNPAREKPDDYFDAMESFCSQLCNILRLSCDEVLYGPIASVANISSCASSIASFGDNSISDNSSVVERLLPATSSKGSDQDKRSLMLEIFDIPSVENGVPKTTMALRGDALLLIKLSSEVLLTIANASASVCLMLQANVDLCLLLEEAKAGLATVLSKDRFISGLDEAFYTDLNKSGCGLFGPDHLLVERSLAACSSATLSVLMQQIGICEEFVRKYEY